MQLEFKSTPLTYLRSCLRQAMNQEQTLELRLPEGMPDLGRILVAGGQARLSSKQWRSDSVTLSGGIQAWALFAPEDGSAPQLVEGWIPFQGKWNLPEGCREGVLDAHITLRNLDGRILSPRKLMLRASAALCVEAMCPQEIPVYSPQEVPDSVQLLQNSYPIRLCREAGEKVFSVEDTVFGDKGLPEKIFFCRILPRVTEQAVASDQLILRGILELQYLGIQAEGAMDGGCLELPFAQLVQLDGAYDKDATCGVCLHIAASDWQREGEGLRLRCELVAQYRISDVSLLSLAQDAYSHQMTMETQMQQLTLPVLLEERAETLQWEQNIPIPANKVLDVAVYPDEPITYLEGDRLVSELPGLIQVLYEDENLSAQTTSEPFCCRWELQAGEGCHLNLRSGMDSQPEMTLHNGQLQLTGERNLWGQICVEQTFPMVTGLRLGETRQPDPSRPSVILRRAGEDTLWDLAKRHGSTIDAIKSANHLAGEPDLGQMLLIPVL